ncbi:MAG: hypothetical protein ACKPER_11100, partial [Dolichospermum sp.]
YRYAYQDFKEKLVSQSISWNKRQEILYWRGSSTGDKEDDYQWRIMPRFRLCQLATEVVNKELFDIKITRITNRFSSPEVIEEIKNSPSQTFGELFIFVDECHRTQSGKLHKVMKAMLSNAVFIGFTG